MASIPYKVAEAFMAGAPAQSGAFVSVGDAIYSYALKLAHSKDGLAVWDVDPKRAAGYSVTTARHVKALLSVLPADSR